MMIESTNPADVVLIEETGIIIVRDNKTGHYLRFSLRGAEETAARLNQKAEWGRKVAEK